MINNLGEGSIPKLMAKLAIPAVVAQVVNLLYNIVDRIYIGHIPQIGADALTGVGLFTPVLMLLNAFAMLAGSGGAPRAAIYMGKKDNATAEKIVGNCFTFLVICAVVLTAGFYGTLPVLLKWFGASSVTMPYALSYSRIYVLGSIFVLIVLGMNLFITTQGFAKISMLTTVIGAVINIILDPVFIFVFNMGVQGAALATVLSQAVGAVWILHFLTGDKTILRLRKCNLKLKSTIIMPCLALGISSFVMLSTESILSVSFTSSLSRYGGDLAAALRYGRQYMLVMLCGLPAFMMVQTYASTLRECGETMVPMKAGVTAVLVNLVFNYLLIYGKFGFPELGVVGAAIATVLSRYVEMAIVLIWTHKHKEINTYIV